MMTGRRETVHWGRRIMIVGGVRVKMVMKVVV